MPTRVSGEGRTRGSSAAEDMSHLSLREASHKRIRKNAASRIAEETAEEKSNADPSEGREGESSSKRRKKNGTDHLQVLTKAPAGTSVAFKTIPKPVILPSSLALDKLAVPPTLYCTIEKHPVKREKLDETSDLVGIMEIQIDAYRYVPMPQGFCSLQNTQTDMALAILRLFAIIVYLMNKARAVEYTTHQNYDDTGKKVGKPVEKQVEKNNILMYFERVPHKNNPLKFVAYRIRIMEIGYSNRRGLVAELQDLLVKNDARLLAEAVKMPRASRGAEKPVPADHITMITSPVWSQMCLSFNPVIFTARNASLASQVISDDSPCNPFTCFNLESNCRTAAALGAHPDYCDPSSYYVQANTRQFVFPQRGVNAWRIDPAAFNPSTRTMNMFLLPCVEQDPKSSMIERDRFAQKWGFGPEQRAISDKLYNATQNHSAPAAQTTDIKTLIARVKSDDASLRNSHSHRDEVTGITTTNVAYYKERQDMARDVWIPMLDAINCPSGNCGSALQAMAQYLENYKQVHSTLALPRHRSFKNLSRSFNHIACDAVELDKVMTVLHMHQDVLLALYSLLSLYRYESMNFNHLLLGDPGIGKSFLQWVLKALFIEGTWESMGTLTNKAFNVPGKAHAFLMCFLDDAQSTMFEHGKQGSSSDLINLHKTILTNKELITNTVEMDPRKNVRVHGDLCLAIVANMNNDRSSIDAAIKDRYCITNAAVETVQPGARSIMMDVTNRMREPAVREACATMGSRFHHLQACTASLMQSEAIGALHPVSMDAAAFAFGMLCDIASSRNLRMTDRQRSSDRFFLLVSSLVHQRAVDLLYQCPGATWEGVDHDPTHVLAADKHLFSRVEDFLVAVALMTREWQDRVILNVQQGLLTCFFPNCASDMQAYQNMQLSHKGEPSEFSQEPDLVQPNPLTGAARLMGKETVANHAKVVDEYNCLKAKREYWMYAKAAIGPAGTISAVPCNRPSGPTTEEIVAHLAKHLCPRLQEKFRENEVRDKLMQLLSEQVTVTKRQFADEECIDREMVTFTKEYPKLVVSADMVMVAWPVLEQMSGHASELLFQCVQDTCSVLAAVTKHALVPGEAILYPEFLKQDSQKFIMREIKLDTPEQLEARGIDYKNMAVRRNNSFSLTGVQRVVQANQGVTNPEAFSTHYMSRLFPAGAPWTRMDCCLDQRAAVLRAHDIGISHNDMHMHPSADPFVQHAEFQRIEEENDWSKQMQHYPDSLMIDDESEKECKKRAADGADGVSFRQDTRKMMNQNKTRPDLLAPFIEELKQRGAEHAGLSQPQLQQQSSEEEMPPLEGHGYEQERKQSDDRDEAEDMDMEDSQQPPLGVAAVNIPFAKPMVAGARSAAPKPPQPTKKAKAKRIRSLRSFEEAAEEGDHFDEASAPQEDDEFDGDEAAYQEMRRNAAVHSSDDESV
jgi:hypothetical protein